VERGEQQWQVALTLRGARLGRVDPVPLLISQIQELEGGVGDHRSLYTVLTELYLNALDHGVLGLNSSMKSDPEGFNHYCAERSRRLRNLSGGEVSIRLECVAAAARRLLRVRVADSGPGFDWQDLDAGSTEASTRLYGRGLLLVRGLCLSLRHRGRGNVAEAVYALRDDY
jgi:signal transduction histidine kinase